MNSHQDLALFLANHQYKGPFAVHPWWSAEGDFISIYWEDQRSFSRRVNEWLTLYYSMRDKITLTGCKIKGVSVMQAERSLLARAASDRRKAGME